MSIDTGTSLTLPRIIAAKRHVDHRGWLSEIFHEKRLQEFGITCGFVQDNLSVSSRAGTLRGLHFQIPPAAQSKLVIVLSGRILDVAVDVRQGSPTFGKSVSVELSAETGHQVYVPIGFAHGFLTLEDDVAVMYKVSGYYAQAHERGIRWNDPDVAFPWLVKSANVIISEKDARLPFLKNFVSPFPYNGPPLGELTTPDSIQLYGGP